MPKIAIIAAMHREIAPLVHGWHNRDIQVGDRKVRIYENDLAIVACGGVGGNPARSATDAVYRNAQGKVREFISTGFAGALLPGLKVGDIFQPSSIIGDSDNTIIELSSGRGTLVSAGAVAGPAHKKIFAEKYQAQAIDMEAFSVADVARIYNVSCRVIKAISDEYDFAMPPMGRFVTESGGFKSASFAAYAALRPWIWTAVMKLRRDSQQASMSLSAALRSALENTLS